MLSPKEISSLFEVQVNTLYNWRKTKPDRTKLNVRENPT